MIRLTSIIALLGCVSCGTNQVNNSLGISIAHNVSETPSTSYSVDNNLYAQFVGGKWQFSVRGTVSPQQCQSNLNLIARTPSATPNLQFYKNAALISVFCLSEAKNEKYEIRSNKKAQISKRASLILEQCGTFHCDEHEIEKILRGPDFVPAHEIIRRLQNKEIERENEMGSLKSQWSAERKELVDEMGQLRKELENYRTLRGYQTVPVDGDEDEVTAIVPYEF